MKEQYEQMSLFSKEDFGVDKAYVEKRVESYQNCRSFPMQDGVSTATTIGSGIVAGITAAVVATTQIPDPESIYGTMAIFGAGMTGLATGLLGGSYLGQGLAKVASAVHKLVTTKSSNELTDKIMEDSAILTREEVERELENWYIDIVEREIPGYGERAERLYS